MLFTPFASCKANKTPIIEKGLKNALDFILRNKYCGPEADLPLFCSILD